MADTITNFDEAVRAFDKYGEKVRNSLPKVPIMDLLEKDTTVVEAEAEAASFNNQVLKHIYNECRAKIKFYIPVTKDEPEWCKSWRSYEDVAKAFKAGDSRAAKLVLWHFCQDMHEGKFTYENFGDCAPKFLSNHRRFIEEEMNDYNEMCASAGL